MKKSDGNESIYEVAREAIDQDELARVLELAGGEECDRDAVQALEEVTVETLIADALAAAAHARRRGRPPTGDDVGNAAEKRRSCCGDQPQPESPPAQYPAILKGVW